MPRNRSVLDRDAGAGRPAAGASPPGGGSGVPGRTRSGEGVRVATGPRGDTGPPDGFEDWIESALAYVPVVARRFLGCGLPFDELLAAGNLGLVEAALRFDPDRNVKFVTYADWWIRKTVLQAIQQQSGAVRLPRYRLERMRILRELRADLRAAHGQEPSVEEVARAGGMSDDEVRGLMASGQSVLSLDQPTREDSRRSLGDLLPADRDDGHPEAVVDEDYQVHVRNAIADLDARERAILSLRFGFLGSEPLTLREVGQRLRLSRERVRQIERRALLRLRRRLDGA